MPRPRSIVVLTVLPAALVGVAAAVLALGALRAPARWIDALYRAFARLSLAVGNTPIEVRGREHLHQGGVYVVVANHESSWDPMVLVVALASLRVRFVMKEAMARLPVVGRALRLTGNVTVCRADTRADVARLQEAMARRDPTASLLFFAEGTRSRDGALHPFKQGAFATAIAAGLPILPIGIAGTRAVLPPDTLDLHPGPVVVEIGRPIAAPTETPHARDRLRESAFAAVRTLRRRARHRLHYALRRARRRNTVVAPPVRSRRPTEVPAAPGTRAGF